MASSELDSYISGLEKASSASTSAGANPKQEEGQYFVDPNTGQYYFQSGNGEAMAVVPSDETEARTNPTNLGPSTSDNQVVSDTGDDQYQTVTCNAGEVSYVLIVQQPKDKDNGGSEEVIGVYDFKNKNDFNDKSNIRKIKKSQQVTKDHMCNYCNYKTSKRYLLSRHMISHSEDRPHKCLVCERGFKTLASLQNHVKTHTDTNPHRCKFCDSTFTTSLDLVLHVRYHHKQEQEQEEHEQEQ